MAETLSVRAEDEVRDKFNELFDQSGLPNKGDFLDTLIKIYQASKAADGVPLLQSDIKAVMQATMTIYNTYMNLGNKIKTNNEVMELKFKETLDKKEEERIKVLRELGEKEDLFNKIQAQYLEVSKELEESTKEIDRLENAGRTQDELIKEYREKNDTLTGLLNDYKSYKESHDTLLGELQNTKNQLSEAIVTIKNKESEVNILNERIEAIESNKIKEIQAIKEANKNDKDKALNLQEKEHQKEIKEINKNFNTEIEKYRHEADKAKDEINNLKDKLRDFEKYKHEYEIVKNQNSILENKLKELQSQINKVK